MNLSSDNPFEVFIRVNSDTLITYVVTSLLKQEYQTRRLYEELNCAQGNIENVIKEHN